jgi:hypothetical protein
MNTKTTTPKPTPLNRFIDQHANEVLAALYLAEAYYADAAKQHRDCEHLDPQSERNRFRSLRRKLVKVRR